MSALSQSFTEKETWRGGHYEIEFDLGQPSDDRIGNALQAVWSHSSVTGPYLSRGQEPKNQFRVDAREQMNAGHLYGTVTLANGSTAACGTYVCKLEDEGGTRLRDLLSFYVPLCALSKVYAVGAYPFSDIAHASEWRPALDKWLVDLGLFLFARVQFQLALVGFEVDFPAVTSEAIQRNGIPPERYDGFLWKVDDQLEWYPPTNFELIRIQSPK